LEDAGIDFYFFDARTVEFFEGGHDAGFFSCAGGAVDEEMGEVSALGLDGVRLRIFEREENVREIADGRRDHGGRIIDRGIEVGVCLRGAPWYCWWQM